MKTRSKVKSASVNLVVVRADGRKEDLGRVAYWDRSLLKRLAWKLRFGRFRTPKGNLILVPLLALPEHQGLISLLPLLPLAVLQVNSGRAVVTGRLLGVTQAVPNQQGWGTGVGTTAAADTTLFSEVNPGGLTTGTRTTGTMSQVTTTTTNDTEQVVATITATAALAITNGGLFDNATIGIGTLWFKNDFATVNVAINDAIQFTNKVQYA